MDSSTLDHSTGDGDEGSDGHAPFTAELVGDGTGDGHGEDGADEDDGDVERDQGSVQIEVLRVGGQNLEAVLRWSAVVHQRSYPV